MKRFVLLILLCVVIVLSKEVSATRIFTSGLESNSLATEGFIITQGTPTITSILHNSGSYALNNSANTTYSPVIASCIIPSANPNRLYGRFYLQVHGVVDGNYILQHYSSAGQDITLSTDASNHIVLQTASTVRNTSVFIPSRDVWFMIQYGVFFNGTGSEVIVRIYDENGTLRETFNRSDTLTAGTIQNNTFAFGGGAWNNANVGYFFDDIALNNELGGSDNFFPDALPITYSVPYIISSSLGSENFSWINPMNASLFDGVYTYANFSNLGSTYYLNATNFNFSVPVGATINGIMVTVSRNVSSNNTVGDYNVSLLKRGVIVATNKANSTNWSTVLQNVTYGSSSDLWGASWSVDDINNFSTGVIVSGISYVNVGSGSVMGKNGTVYTNGQGNPGTSHRDWVNPYNAGKTDNVFAWINLTLNQNTSWMNITGLSMGIPSTAIIDGILVAIERKASTTLKVRDQTLYLMRNGTINSTNKNATTLYTNSDVVAYYGGSSDLWGGVWSPIDFDNSSTGILFSAWHNVTAASYNVTLDNINISVYWHYPLNSLVADIDYLHIDVYYTNASTLPLPLYFWNGSSLQSQNNSKTLYNQNSTPLGFNISGRLTYNFTQSAQQILYNDTGIPELNISLNNSVYACFNSSNLSGTDAIWSNRLNADNINRLDITGSGSSMRYGVRNSTTEIIGASTGVLLNDTWYCIVANNWGSSRVELWLNGVNQTGTTTPNTVVQDGFSVGAFLPTSYYGNVKVAFVAIFNTTLTQANILSLNTSWLSYNPYPSSSSDSCTYSGSGDWSILGSDNCVLSIPITLESGHNISVTGVGTLKICTVINGWKMYNQVWTTKLNFCAGGRLG